MADQQVVRAVVRYDPRPFFVRALDAAIGARWCDAVEVDRIEMDVVNMAFRYHARMGWDIRDSDTMQTATEIVLMYVDDGLQLLSSGDVDRAAWLVVDRPLTDFFRASWGEVEANRRALVDIVRASRVVLGEDVTRVIASAVPRWSVDPDPTELRSYADSDLFKAMREGVPLAQWREHLRAQVARARERQLVFPLLPIDEVRARWASFGETYTLLPDEELDVSLFGWLGACIRVCTRGDLGVVVRTQDIEQFLRDHVERAHGSGGGSFASWMKFTIDAALDAFDELLHVRGDARVRDGIRHALEEAIDQLGYIIGNANARRGAKSFPIWVNWWRQITFLELTNEERARAIVEDDTLSADEAMERLQHIESHDDRVRLIDTLDIANASAGLLIDLFSNAPDIADEICTRMIWDDLSTSTLCALSESSLPTRAMRAITQALVTRRRSLRNLPTCIVFDCLLAFEDDPENGPALRRRLFMGWRKTPLALLKVFRWAGSNEERAWWVQLALESPEHFAYIVADALPHERSCIASVLGQGGDVPKLDPQTVVAAFRWMEERAHQAGSRRARTAKTRVFIDADVLAIWSHVSPALRDAIREAGTGGREPISQPRRKKVAGAKK